MLLLLDDNTLGLVLQHCREDDTPDSLAACACRRLSDVSRSYEAYIIRLDNAQFAQLPAISASTTAPFAGCTSLEFTLESPIASLLDGQAVAAALAAPGRWPGLKRLHLDIITYTCSEREEEEADQYAGCLISSLSSLKQLQELSIDAPIGPCCLASLGAASHITQLGLRWAASDNDVSCDLSALGSLSNLKHLNLDGPGFLRSLTTGSNSSSSNSSSSSCLPSSLVALGCSLYGLEKVHWLHHLAGCSGLQQLRVTYAYVWDMRTLEDTDRAPPSVLDLAAQHTTGLTSLLVEYNVAFRPKRSMFAPPQPHRHPEPDQLRINPFLTQLTRLQHLRLWGDVQLQISTDQEWRHFSCLASLQSLAGVNITQAPPAGVQLRQLKELSCSVTLSIADMGLLLAAFPALMDVTLEVASEVAPKEAPRGSSSSASGNSSNSHTPAAPASAAAHTVWPCSSSSNICLSYGEHMTAEAAAAHFAAGAPALARLRRLSLTWPQSSTSSPHLPHLAALTALTSLSLTGQGEGGCVQEEDLVLALQPLSATLRVLYLRNLPLVTPRVVMMLQGVLQGLQRFEIAECGRLKPDRSVWYHKDSNCRPEEEQLQLLKRFVRPGLIVCYDPDAY